MEEVVLDKIQERFNSWEPEKRIEAVVHDGQWTTRDKWSKLADVSIEELDDYIEKNRQKLVITELGNYRMPGRYILDWYKENDLDIEEEIVPGNFPARVWGGMSEAEYFIDNPIRIISKVKVSNADKDTKRLIEKAVLGAGYILSDGNDIEIYCTDPKYIIKLIDYSLFNNKKRKKISTVIRNGFKNRDLSRFNNTFWINFLKFYKEYAKISLVPHFKTIRKFINHEDDIEAQIEDWIAEALSKYDETQCVPFAAYLNNVLRFWPYNLPAQELGSRLAQFERDRSRAIAELSYENDQSNHSEEEIAEAMSMDIEEYKEALFEYNTKISARHNHGLEFEESGLDKKATSITDNSYEPTPELAYMISLSALEAVYNTDMVDSGNILINAIEDSNFNRLKLLHEDFKREFEICLLENQREMLDEED